MKRKKRIGYMALDETANENLQTNGGGGGGDYVQPTAEPIDIYPQDPLQETEEPMPQDVAVQLGQEVAADPVPPQMQSYLAPTVTPTTDPAAEPAASGFNWKLIAAIVIVGYLLTRKS